MIKGSPWDTRNSNVRTLRTLGMDKEQQKRINKWQNIRKYSSWMKKNCFTVKSKIIILSDVVLNGYRGSI